VETSHYTDAASMPIVHYGRKFVEEDERKIRYRGIGINENGELAIKTSRHSIKFPVSFKTHPRRFPKLKIALMDRSGSMAWHPDGMNIDTGDKSFIPWGVKSKYHFALKGYFGIDNFLEGQGVSNYIDNCVLGFSGEQVIKGNAREVAEALLVMPSGNTSFDIDALEEEIAPDSFVLSISDGEFSLSDAQKQRLKEKVAESDYAHIQIGSDTGYSSYLEQIGVPVFNVKGDDDLSKIMVNFVSSYYKKLPISLLREK
ncbi:hypothetical protein GOV06_03395, partial [Candidatus Woesearchaeota archaeon]|nr:hypothetical protein [Candidatus Woesearchaeota archaeon]